MKYCVFIRKDWDRTITANYGGYLVWRARKTIVVKTLCGLLCDISSYSRENIFAVISEKIFLLVK